MGGGSYCYNSAVTSRTSKGWASEHLITSSGMAVPLNYVAAAREEIFTARNINNAMNPFGVAVRESRDSEEHPESLAIIIGLDVTGSMGSVPHYLVKEGLPKLMARIIQGGVLDPQVLFVGIGDHECDNAPLQVGQFESSDELLDKWLTDVYLEGGGGGNTGESYMLAWQFAAAHTAIDCFEKRGKKGLLFTIGDEPCLPRIPKYALDKIMGPGQNKDVESSDLLRQAGEKYDVFHIHIRETTSGSRTDRIPAWKQLIQDNLLVAEHHEDVAGIISDVVLKHCGKTAAPEGTKEDQKKDEIIL